MRILPCQVTIGLYLAVSIQTACASSLYAFYTQRSIQIAAQDPDTGKIVHSSCNSLDTPVFPIENPNVLPTFSSPRNGTALTAAGWWDGTNILASVFFQNEDGEVVNCFYECDMETGRFNRTAESYPSVIARVDSVHEQTGLSVELLREDGNRLYRLFYHNMDRQVMMMSWRQDKKLWTDAGVVSPDNSLGMTLHSAYHEGRGISVAFPRGSRDIEVARLAQDDLWQLESFPHPLTGKPTNETAPSQIKLNETSIPEFALPFWDPDTQAVGHSVARRGLREVYYIGTDKTLYQARESESDDGWFLGPNGSHSNWPKADERSGGLAVVSPPKARGDVWVYYWSDGAIIQAHKSASGVWDEALTLPANATDADSARPSTEHEQGGGTAPSSWSTAAKAGVGVGVSACVLTAGALIWFLATRRSALDLGSKARGRGMESGCYSDLPELYIVQRATPIAVHSAESSVGRQPVELEQPAAVYELVGRSER